MLPTDYLQTKAREIILTHPLMHSLAISRSHKTNTLKIHIFEVDSELKHRTTFNAYFSTPLNYDELIIIMCYTWNTIEYFALIVPGTMNPYLLPDYPVMCLSTLESIILPQEYHFQVREYIHEGTHQPLLTDFKNKIYFIKNAKPARRRCRSLGCKDPL